MKLSQLLQHCLNYKVLIGVGIVIALFYFFAPQLAQYSWLLIALVCPLSMMLMMKGMQHAEHKSESQDTNNNNKS